MGVVDTIFEIQRSITESLEGTAVSMIMPRGIASISDGGMRCIYTSDSSLLSVFEIHGTRYEFGPELVDECLVSLAKAVKSTLKNRGCTVQVCMHRDRKQAGRLVTSLISPMSRAAMSLGIDITGITEDWAKALAKRTANEHIYVAIWTHPEILVPAVLREERKNRRLAPVCQGGQNPTVILKGLQAKHMTAVSNFAAAFRGVDLVFDELSPEDATRAMRLMMDAEWTSDSWRPWVTEGDTTTMPSLPSLTYVDMSHAWVMPETLANQIMPREAVVIGDEIVRIGSRLHFPFMNKLMPQKVTPFYEGFFESVNEGQFPWRITWTLRGGQGPEHLNSALAKILHFFSGTNRKINAAYDSMKEYIEGDGTPVTVQMSYDTWIDAPVVTKESIAQLRKWQAQLAGIVQSWGTQETVNVTGDPYPVLISTIPGLNWRSPAPVTLAPIEDIFLMMPFMDRAASPWESGIPFRTPDGKLFPYALMSTNQAAWITFFIAPMGAGKSVLMNVESLFFIFNPKIKGIPYCYTIDIGPSSSGLIRAVRDNLPDDMKHYACEFTLRNVTEQSINVFDTGLGCREPFPAHRNFLVNLLTLIATPVNVAEPYDGMHDFARSCVDHAYRMAQESKVKLYTRGICREVDTWIDACGLKTDEQTTWWELTDRIFSMGDALLAAKAQRHAVPTLEDIAHAAREDVLRDPYMSVPIDGEALPDYFYRHIMAAIASYPVLSSYTRFDIGEARIASIDLDHFKASGAEGSKIMAIMFMVAEHCMAGKFYQDYPDLDILSKYKKDANSQLIPVDGYRQWHMERIKEIKELPKRLSIDELHRITANSGVVARAFVQDICTRARESRKWGVSFAFATQMYKDIPPEIIELTTTLYVLGSGTAKGAESIAETYGMDLSIADHIYGLRPPDKAGSTMLALFRTKDGKPYYHILTLTVGEYMLWALNSTKNERIVRDTLSKEFGFGKALDILVDRYPGGVSKTVEQRQQEISTKGGDGNVIDEIIRECVAYGKSEEFRRLHES